MKLQAKFTLHFILIVLITLVVSFLVINWRIESQFNNFMREKNQEWIILTRGNQNMMTIRPFNRMPGVVVNPLDPEAPEDRFLHTATNSLLQAGAIGIFLAIILAYFFSKFLLQRIYGLKTSMHQYMQDGATKPVLHGSDDEIDELSNIYNLLIEKIKKEEKIRRDFFVDMSHELRTPLTSIKGYLEGLVDNVFDQQKEKEIHAKTLKETDRMIHLVKEMTSLAKLESEEPILLTENTDIKKLTQEVIEMFSSEIDERGIKLEIHGELKADVDPNKFKQIVINLVDNAVHYGKKGELIGIEMGVIEGNQFWKIKNKAEGVNEQDLEYFFERFYRADKSRKKGSHKTHLGIGLNIVKRIVEQHQGTIVAKMDGEYVVFEILLIPRKI